jgi:16S rRNA (uracil1498-N3)-methyltransferase
MLPRLLIDSPMHPGAEVQATKDQSHYLLRVLRLTEGADVRLFDGRGHRYAATIARTTPGACLLEVGQALPATPESPLAVTLAQCLSTADKMDWTIEKAVELGVARIIPLMSRRSTVQLDATRALRKADHWRRLIEAACGQCGRDMLPTLEPLQNAEQWAAGYRDQGKRLVLDPGAPKRLSTLSGPLGSVTLLVGPESGLAPQEVACAQANEFEAVCMGPRVLRTETAGLAALASLQYAFGDF